MPLDLESLKQRFMKRPANDPAAAKPGNTGKVGALQQGFKDIQAVFEEGNFKLFVKQLVVILLVFLGVRFLLGKLTEQKNKIADQMAAISMQQSNQDEYLANKERLLLLEPLFPDISKKNEWMLQTLMKAFSDHKIDGNINGNSTEKTEGSSTVVTQEVTFQKPFNQIGQFLADIESGDAFLRVSNLTINKLNDPNQLGENSVNVTFNTVFPKEKYAPKLFKDYDKRIKELAAQKASATQENANAK